MAEAAATELALLPTQKPTPIAASVIVTTIAQNMKKHSGVGLSPTIQYTMHENRSGITMSIGSAVSTLVT